MVSDLGTRLDWLGAVWLTILTINWAIRWYSKIPGRYISLSGWLIILNGILILRWPRLFGVNATVEIEYSTRFVVYVVASWLQYIDWKIGRGLTPDEKRQIITAIDLLKLKKKEKGKGKETND